MFKLLIIWRYFVRRRIAWVAVAAVALVVTLVIVVLSIMSGLLNNIRNHNHNWTGDLVLSRDSLAGIPYYKEFIQHLTQTETVEAATPVITTFAMVHSQVVQLYGLRLDEYCRVTRFADSIHWQFSNDSLSFTLPENAYILRNGKSLSDEQRRRGCIRGKYVGIREYKAVLPIAPPDWPVTVFAIDARGLLTGAEAGEHQTFWTLGDSDTKLLDIDGIGLYVDFDELQKLTLLDGTTDGIKRTHQIRIKLKPGIDLIEGKNAVADQWQTFVITHKDDPAGNLLGDVTLQTWKEFRRARIAPAEKEKSLLILVFGMISFVCMFIVFAIFYMIVTEKVKDLGIIKSLGGSNRDTGQIFIGYGLLVGLVGAALGTTLGWNIVTHTNQIEAVLNKHFGFRLWDPSVYIIDRIPDVVDPAQAATIAVVAVLVCLLGALAPAQKAAKLHPVETLRVE